LFSTAATADKIKQSKYIHETARLLAHVRKEIVAPLVAKRDIAPWIKTLASHLLTLFLRHASLIKPLTESLKLKFANVSFFFRISPIVLTVACRIWHSWSLH
jgi:hypothetical protein